nr:hypothetical protein [Tanacetum cinerariifolium]
MGTCLSSLLANKAVLMLFVKAARYIIRTCPCIGAVSIGKVFTNFFISRSAAAASYAYWIPIDRNGYGDPRHISMSPRKDICVGP